MNPEEIFKRFFGTSFPELDNRRFSPVDDRDGNNKSGKHHFGTDQFGDFHHQIPMMMEELERQLPEIFHIYVFPDHYTGPDTAHTLPEIPGEINPDSGSHPRDQMLKENKESTPPSQAPAQPSKPSFGTLFSPWFEEFTGSPRINRLLPEDRIDKDMDSKRPDVEEIAEFYEQSKNPYCFFSRGNSVNIRTVVGADGVMEEQRTVRDSNGREETTITRKMGDSSHTVTTIKDEKGQVEKHEVFQNVDKDKMSEFDKKWEGKSHSTDPLVTDPNTALQEPFPRGGILGDSRGFFRKFFGF